VSNWLPNELYWQTLFCGGLSVSQGVWLTLKGGTLLASSSLLRPVIHLYSCCSAILRTYGKYMDEIIKEHRYVCFLGKYNDKLNLQM